MPETPITHAFRLKPGQDLKKSIDSFVKEKIYRQVGSQPV